MESEPSSAEPLTCERIGTPDPDIAGIGILLSFSLQALLTLLLAAGVWLASRRGKMDITSAKGTREHQIQSGRVKIVSKVMMLGNDTQILTGLALIITGLASARDIDLYHLRLIYETVSFVGISGAAATIVWHYSAHEALSDKEVDLALSKQGSGWSNKFKALPEKFHRNSPRHRVLYTFSALFAALTILLCVRLSEWDLEGDGTCYISTGLTTPDASHPAADITYVAITAAWNLFSIAASIFGGPKRMRSVMVLAASQFPLHLYMMLQLRIKNSSHLEGEESEDDWRFGQTVAVLLLGATLRDIWHGIKQLYRYNKIAKVKMQSERVNTVDMEEMAKIQEETMAGRV